MNPPSQSHELQEVYLQEAELKQLADRSLPAEQVIEEQSKDVDAKGHLAPRFIP